MNVVTAVKKLLEADSTVVAAATAGIAKYRLRDEVENTGKVGVVVLPSGNWFRTFQSALFPRIMVQVHSDVTRDGEGNAVRDDAHDRCLETWAAIDAVLHRTTRETVTIGDVRVLGSERETEPSFVSRPGENTELLLAVYDLKVG